MRLSRGTDNSTSPERQAEIGRAYVSAHGGTVVDVAEDVGVSASVAPWERPELGPWLRGSGASSITS